MKAVVHNFMVRGDVVIGIARHNDVACGGILILCHGRSATYQIGWTSDRGRTCGAHNVLLWQALAQLKARGITTLDLGGMNDETAKGVKAFKEGLGGRTIRTAGLYT